MVHRSNRSTRQDVRNLDILLRAQQGTSHQALALEYGISINRILQIVQKEQRWLDKGYYDPLLNH